MGGIRIGLAVALVVLSGCSEGGQSSDDGTPFDGGPFDGGPHQPSEDAGPDAAMPEFTIVVEVVLDGSSIVGCGAGFTAAQVAVDARGAVLGAPNHCRNNGGFDCECEGERVRSEASGCEAALFEACGVAAEAIDGSGELAVAPATCDSQSSAVPGRCARQDDGDYACTCGDPSEEPTSPIRIAVDGEANPASCELALFRACEGAMPCGDEFGTCQGGEDAIRSFTCTCSTNGLSRSTLGRSCTDALDYACSPLSGFDEHCSGYGGHCVSTDPVENRTMRCTCADGTEHDVDHVPMLIEPRVRACRYTLEQTCGLGSPPEASQCLAEGNGHHARCTRGPAGDQPLVCECYLDQGAAFANDVGTVDSETCDREVLEAFCPNIAPLPEGAAEAACDHYIACERPMTGFDRDVCIANAGDACVACVLGERARIPASADGCPSEPILCHEACASIVPREDALAACEQSLQDQRLLTPEASCMCDRCYPWFGECVADAGCFEILDCAVRTGCSLATCGADPECGAVVAHYRGTRSFGLAVNLGGCEASESCKQ